MRITTYVYMNSFAFSLAINQRLGPLGIGLLMPNHIVYFQKISILPPTEGNENSKGRGSRRTQFLRRWGWLFFPLKKQQKSRIFYGIVSSLLVIGQKKEKKVKQPTFLQSCQVAGKPLKHLFLLWRYVCESAVVDKCQNVTCTILNFVTKGK